MDVKRVALSAFVGLGLLGIQPLAAQDATPVGEGPGLPPLPEGCSVIAEGLLNPRYVAVADDGTIYVSEAGVGGDEVVEMPAMDMASPEAGADMGATPEDQAAAEEGPGEAPSTRGYTGRVSAIAPDGTTTVVADGLPSYAIGGVETTGPAGIAVGADGQIILSIGGAGPMTPMVEPLENENSVVSIEPATGDVTQLADIGAYERANNPDPYNIDSNLYGVAVADDGTIYVNDAGGNATYRIPAGGGEPEVLAVHPGIEIPADQAPPGGNPFRGGANELDPVPTALMIGAEGNVLSGLLSGGPFPPGAAKVVRIAPDGSLTDVAMGLTMVVGLAAGPDGQLYVSQISTNFLGEMPAPGNVVRVLEDGTQEVVADGLFLPNGIDFDADGNLIVAVNSVSMGPPNGQVLRCEGVAAQPAAVHALPVERFALL